MKTYKQKLTQALVTGVVALTLTMGWQTQVRADSNTNNDSAALLVRITPNADRGVTISSGNVNLDLGYVDIGASTQTVNPATVTIQGNLTNTELDLSGSITGGWTFDNTQTFDAGALDALGVWATFTSISTGIAPAQGDEYFRVGTSSGAKLVSATNSFASTAVGVDPGTGFGRFESNAPGANMDALNPTNQRHMFVYFRLPSQTSVTTQQSINFVLSSKQGN